MKKEDFEKLSIQEKLQIARAIPPVPVLPDTVLRPSILSFPSKLRFDDRGVAEQVRRMSRALIDVGENELREKLVEQCEAMSKAMIARTRQTDAI